MVKLRFAAEGESRFLDLPSLSLRTSRDDKVISNTAEERSIERFGLEADVLFAGGFFLGVFFHPGLPAFARGGVASGEGEGGDVGVGGGNFLAGIFWIETDCGVFQGCS